MGKQAQLNVKLIAHTQLTPKLQNELARLFYETGGTISSGRAVSLIAIRTCYSPNKPTEILKKEGVRYFGHDATDGQGGTEADRLFRQIVASKHLSTLEHLSFTFAVEGISRACLAQLTRHRIGFSYSVQSQRHVKFGSDDKTGGFDYVIPESVKNSNKRTLINEGNPTYVDEGSVEDYFRETMAELQYRYNTLRELGIPAEDARMVLPQAAATNLVMTANLRALLDFYAKRHQSSGAQWEIANLAEALRAEVVRVEPWLDQFFEKGGA